MHQDFPTAEDHSRFQTDYQFDPYEDRQTETRVCFFQVLICTYQYKNVAQWGLFLRRGGSGGAAREREG